MGVSAYNIDQDLKNIYNLFGVYQVLLGKRTMNNMNVILLIDPKDIDNRNLYLNNTVSHIIESIIISFYGRISTS